VVFLRFGDGYGIGIPKVRGSVLAPRESIAQCCEISIGQVLASFKVPHMPPLVSIASTVHI